MFGEDISVLYITLLKDENVWNTLLTVTYSCATPLNIGANLLLTYGIIKAKWNKFNSLPILFLTLF